MLFRVHKRGFPDALRPRKYPEPEPGWRHVVHLNGGVPEDCWLSLGDEYLVLGGALAHGGTLLVDPGVGAPLTLETALQMCALLSFLNDAAVLPQQWRRSPKRLRSANLPHYDKALRGIVNGSVQRYLEKLSKISEVTEDLFCGPPHGYERDLPWEGLLSLPRQPRTWRALSAYWSGLLSFTFPGRILNFWRAAEAVTSKQDRYALFGNLPAARVAPIWLRRRFVNTGPKRLDAVKMVRRAALRQHRDLIAAHGSAANALDVLFWSRRGQAAHADKSALEFDHLLDLGQQARDALLIQYLARAAIEGNWA